MDKKKKKEKYMVVNKAETDISDIKINSMYLWLEGRGTVVTQHFLDSRYWKEIIGFTPLISLQNNSSQEFSSQTLLGETAFYGETLRW